MCNKSSNNHTIIVIGSNGKLGRAISRYYTIKGWNVISLSRKDMDLSSKNQIQKMLNNLDFSILFCCAAMTFVDKAEDSIEQARLINSKAPEIIAKICAKKGAKMIFISTDYVYDGTVFGLKNEESPIKCLSVYAKTKYEGEQLVLNSSGNSLVIRTSWLFGFYGESFVDYILKMSIKQEYLEVVKDKFSCPTFANDLSLMIDTLIHKEVEGIVNICNFGECSWFDYAQGILDIAKKKGLPIKCRKIIPVKMISLKNFKAIRPKYTAMSTAKYTKITGIKPRHWNDAMEEFVEKWAKKYYEK